MRESTKDELSIGFKLQQAHSRQHPAVVLTGMDFADDVALISETIEQAQLFLLRVECNVARVGLFINDNKTKYMTFNQNDNFLMTLNGCELKKVDDFLYLGSWVDKNKKGIKTPIAKAWSALSKMDTIWKSNLNRKLKINFFSSNNRNSAPIRMVNLDYNHGTGKKTRWKHTQDY